MHLGLTAAVAYGWLWYLPHIHHHLTHSIHLIALMYAVPGLAGAVLVWSLIQPLFLKQPQARETMRLDPRQEPDFISGIHALCRAIGVAPPVEIQLSWDANASVHFKGRWQSLISGHKVLTIGMSLVGGLTAQRLGMICSFTVNSINAWLERCAYGENVWDKKLRAWADATNEERFLSGIVNLSIAVSFIAMKCTRLLMAGLFHLSLRLSRYMSRQMEFDADRYEALLAGSRHARTRALDSRACGGIGQARRARHGVSSTAI